MKRTGAPLPIFKNKRPRQALVAHPNNNGGISQENPKWGTDSTSYKFTSNPGCTTASCKPAMTQKYTPGPQMNCPTNQEVDTRLRAPPVGAFQQSAGFKNTTPTPVAIGAPVSTHRSYPISKPPVKKFPNPSIPIGAHATMSGRAQEPDVSHNAQMDKPSSSTASSVNTRGSKFQAPSQKRRVLTATAKGMQHWSRYKQQSPMLFEVFGVVCSAPVASGLNAKQFLLQTQDGNIKCLFWEMDRSLPQLVRGRMHRAVGIWCEDKQHLQCYSVRASHANEEAFAQHAVSTSDRTMRQAIAHLPEH